MSEQHKSPVMQEPSEVAEAMDALMKQIVNDPNDQRLRPDYHGDDYVRLLEERAAVDALTGLGTRRLLDERMKQLTDENVHSIGFLFLDVNDFKQVNEKPLNYNYGDNYIQRTASELKDNIARKKTEAFRRGGDEIVVLLKGVHSQEDVDEVGERLVHVFTGGNESRDGVVIPTVSIGGAFVGGEENKELEQVLLGAELAMKDAKEEVKKQPKIEIKFNKEGVIIPLRFSPSNYFSFQESIHGPLASLPRPKPFVVK